MAIYSRSLYGTSTYGPEAQVAVVPTLRAIARDRTSVLLTWTSTGVGAGPSFAPVVSVALVRSLWGVPTNITAGQQLARWDYDVNTYTDTAITPGARYYYGLFLLGAQGWDLASAASVLFPRTHDHEQLLAVAVPDLYHASLAAEPGDGEPRRDDSALSAFLDVVTFGVDQVHTAVEEVVRVGDAHEVDDAVLGAMGASLGVDVATTSASRPARELVAAAGAAAAKRGTTEALAISATAVTGWEVQVLPAVNLLVDNALAGVPATGTAPYLVTNIAQWLSTTQYSPAAVVSDAGISYVNVGPATLTGAPNQPKVGTAASAAQWQPAPRSPAAPEGAYASSQRIGDRRGTTTFDTSGDQGSVTVGTDNSAPTPRVITWTRPPTAIVIGSSTAQAQVPWQTLAPLALGTGATTSSKWASAYPAASENGPQILEASFYTTSPALRPTVFAFTRTGALTSVISASAVNAQTLASGGTGVLSGTVDDQSIGFSVDQWSVPGVPWTTSASDSGTATVTAPNATVAPGAQIALMSTGLNPGSIAVTLAGGLVTRAGIVFCYANVGDYLYATGAQLVRRTNNVESVLATFTAKPGDRLRVAYSAFDSRFDVTVLVNEIVRANYSGPLPAGYSAGLYRA